MIKRGVLTINQKNTNTKQISKFKRKKKKKKKKKKKDIHGKYICILVGKKEKKKNHNNNIQGRVKSTS